MSDVVISLGEVEEVPVTVDEAEEVPVNVGEEVYIKGDKGNTFFPTVSENGDLSWSNDGGLPNPPTVNIKGPQGEPGNYTKPASGIPKSDLESAVQASLDKADTALQEHQDITGKADKVQNATSGNFASLDENGNLTDSGHKHSDYASSGTSVPSGGSTGQVLKKKSATDYDTEWANAGTADALPLAGGTMAGNINMDGNKVSNLPTPTATGDATPKSYADNLIIASDTQPTAPENKVWLDTDSGSGQSYQVPTVAEMNAEISELASELGIVINGNSTPVGASVGQYVIVKNSTISGITDGLYTAAQTIPANTAISSAYLTAVSSGGLNALRSVYSDTIILNGWTYPVFRVVGSGATLIDLALPYPYTAVKSYNFTTVKLFDDGTWKDVSVASCAVPVSQSKCVRILFGLNGVTLTQTVILANLVGTIVLE